jgi:hypothetical protein
MAIAISSSRFSFIFVLKRCTRSSLCSIPVIFYLSYANTQANFGLLSYTVVSICHHKLLLLTAACCGLPAEYPLAFFKEAIILVAVSYQQSAFSKERNFELTADGIPTGLNYL